MNKPEFHIFVCNSFRVSGEPQGICNKQGAADLLQYIEEELLDRDMDGMVSATGCLKVCDRGTAMVIYPQNLWYGGVTEERIDEILDALEEGGVVEDYLIS